MRIFGDSATTIFNQHAQEAGWFWGHNDVLSAEEQTVHIYKNDIFGEREYDTKIHPKLYLHISNTAWSTFTGMLRESFLPWRWQTVYLDHQDGSQVQKALVCTSSSEDRMSDALKQVIGKSLFVASLVLAGRYKEILGNEYLFIPMQGHSEQKEFTHMFGLGSHIEVLTNGQLCHIYRARDIFSRLKYFFLKAFSSDWKEVTVRIDCAQETFLIEKGLSELVAAAFETFETYTIQAQA